MTPPAGAPCLAAPPQPRRSRAHACACDVRPCRCPRACRAERALPRAQVLATDGLFDNVPELDVLEVFESNRGAPEEELARLLATRAQERLQPAEPRER